MHDLRALLGPERTTAEAALARETSTRSVERWIGSGRLVRLHPGWVTVPEWAEDWMVRARAATGYTGGALSHTSALRVHGLVDFAGPQVDITLPVHHRVRSDRRLRVHRSRRPCGFVMVHGLAATSVARAVVDTWGETHRGRRPPRDLARNAVLRAARERRTTAADLEAEIAAVPRLPGLAELREVVGHVRAGIHSHLEVLGLRALAAAGLPPPVLQYEIPLGYRSLHVDAAWPEVRLAVEFDGAAFHAGKADWQRDLRRDAALAALGWVVLRFSWTDVTERAGLCGAQTAAAYAQRAQGVPSAATSAGGMAARRTPWPP